MLDWLIVGGGVHGTYLSLALTTRGGVARDRLRVLDPARQPLDRWRRCCANTGMSRLRSPAVHHLGGPTRPLRELARRSSDGPESLAGPYQRPTLELFDAHVEEVCRAFALAELRLAGAARGVALRRGGGLRVETDSGPLEARRVVLALGGPPPRWPVWAVAAGDARIRHVLDPTFDRATTAGEWGEAVVVGGGLSAVETALSLSSERPGHVTLLHRDELRIRDFDSDPSWLGPRRLRPFRRAPEGMRRRLIDEARGGGSIPPAEAALLDEARRQGRLCALRGEVETVGTSDESLVLHLAPALEGPAKLRGDLVLLATGLEEERRRRGWLERTMRELSLPCAPCGSPRLDAALEWRPGLHATGSLAELELGPLARNIAGALLAAERLLAVA